MKLIDFIKLKSYIYITEKLLWISLFDEYLPAEFRAEGFRFKDVFSLGTVLSKDLVSMDHQGVLFTPTLIRIRVLF